MGWPLALLVLILAIADNSRGICTDWIWEKGYGNDTVALQPLLGAEADTYFPPPSAQSPIWWDGTYSAGPVRDDMWRYNPPGNAWSWWGNSSTLQFCFFAGFYNQSESAQSDMWCFTRDSQSWTMIFDNRSPNVATNGTYSQFNWPDGRGQSCYVTDSKGTLWMINGYDSGIHNPTDIWSLNTTTSQWAYWGQWCPPGQTPADYSPGTQNPGGRDSAVFWITSNDVLYVYGGDDSYNGDVPDIWKIDLSNPSYPMTGRWTFVTLYCNVPPCYPQFPPANPAFPGSRMLGITIIDHTTDKVLMTGGLTKGWSYDAENYLIDRWLFDPLTESFSYIGGPSSYDVAAVYIAQGVADAQQHPSGRAEMSTVFAPELGKLFVFGGFDYSATGYNDMWSLTINACPTPATTIPTAPPATTAAPNVCSISIQSPGCASCSASTCVLTSGPIILTSNFTTLPTSVIIIEVGNSASGLLTSNDSCITLQGSLHVNVTTDLSGSTRVDVASSPCLNASTLVIQVTSPSGSCKSVDGSLGTDSSLLYVLLEPSSDGCGSSSKVPIIIGAALGGFALLLVIFAAIMLIFFKDKLPKWLFHRAAHRKNSRSRELADYSKRDTSMYA